MEWGHGETYDTLRICHRQHFTALVGNAPLSVTQKIGFVNTPDGLKADVTLSSLPLLSMPRRNVQNDTLS